MTIELINISKYYEKFQVLNEINLKIQEGELVALLGPSGSGKTTLLKIIAGLEKPDEGKIVFNGEDHTLKKIGDRQIGFVFQHYALFRHMTVFENIAFGLKVKPKKIRPSKEEIKEKVHSLLKLIKMEEMANRYPSQLSGGQRQRVALARALAIEPRILLLDEPFGALDARVRKELRRWLRRLHDEYSITSIFVTHDQEEALDVADKVVILNQGKIEQMGTPEEVYENPANPFVYNFLGNVNLFHGRIHNGKIQIGSIVFDAPETIKDKTENIVSYIRPYDIEVQIEADDQDNFISAEIIYIRAIGSMVSLELNRLDTHEYIEVEINKDLYKKLNLKEKQKIYIRPKNFKVFISDDYVI